MNYFVKCIASSNKGIILELYYLLKLKRKMKLIFINSFRDLISRESVLAPPITVVLVDERRRSAEMLQLQTSLKMNGLPSRW
jgi:hypothetical protein